MINNKWFKEKLRITIIKYASRYVALYYICLYACLSVCLYVGMYVCLSGWLAVCIVHDIHFHIGRDLDEKRGTEPNNYIVYIVLDWTQCRRKILRNGGTSKFKWPRYLLELKMLLIYLALNILVHVWSKSLTSIFI